MTDDKKLSVEMEHPMTDGEMTSEGYILVYTNWLRNMRDRAEVIEDERDGAEERLTEFCTSILSAIPLKYRDVVQDDIPDMVRKVVDKLAEAEKFRAHVEKNGHGEGKCVPVADHEFLCKEYDVLEEKYDTQVARVQAMAGKYRALGMGKGHDYHPPLQISDEVLALLEPDTEGQPGCEYCPPESGCKHPKSKDGWCMKEKCPEGPDHYERYEPMTSEAEGQPAELTSAQKSALEHHEDIWAQHEPAKPIEAKPIDIKGPAFKGMLDIPKSKSVPLTKEEQYRRESNGREDAVYENYNEELRK